jgi:hypothetical protein
MELCAACSLSVVSRRFSMQNILRPSLEAKCLGMFQARWRDMLQGLLACRYQSMAARIVTGSRSLR